MPAERCSAADKRRAARLCVCLPGCLSARPPRRHAQPRSAGPRRLGHRRVAASPGCGEQKGASPGAATAAPRGHGPASAGAERRRDSGGAGEPPQLFPPDAAGAALPTPDGRPASAPEDAARTARPPARSRRPTYPQDPPPPPARRRFLLLLLLPGLGAKRRHRLPQARRLPRAQARRGGPGGPAPAPRPASMRAARATLTSRRRRGAARPGAPPPPPLLAGVGGRGRQGWRCCSRRGGGCSSCCGCCCRPAPARIASARPPGPVAGGGSRPACRLLGAPAARPQPARPAPPPAAAAQEPYCIIDTAGLQAPPLPLPSPRRPGPSCQLRRHRRPAPGSGREGARREGGRRPWALRRAAALSGAHRARPRVRGRRWLPPPRCPEQMQSKCTKPPAAATQRGRPGASPHPTCLPAASEDAGCPSLPRLVLN